MNSNMEKRRCRYCDQLLGTHFLDLGNSPLANAFPLADRREEKGEFVCPLRLVKCPRCHLVQLTHVVPPEILFSHYLYVSSTSSSFHSHFANYVKAVRKCLLVSQTDMVAVDIGSNDGLLLSCYEEAGMKAVGIEPAKNLAALANEQGRKTLNGFFDGSSVAKILADFGKSSVISANNVFAHIDDIHSVLENVNRLMRDDGIFVIEFPYLRTMIEQLLFDMIYHEHLSYITILPLAYVLSRYQLHIFDIEEVATHGGSLRVYISKVSSSYQISPKVNQMIEEEATMGLKSDEIYTHFADRVAAAKKKIVEYVTQLISSGKSLAGYGAPAKATTLINYCGLSTNEIEFIVDDNSLKQGRLIPGTRIPIVPIQHLQENPRDFLLIFAWNVASDIVKKLDPVVPKGVQFFVPLPEPRLILPAQLSKT